MSSEMIERVARAIRKAIEESEHNFGESGIEATCVDAALAALAEIREPTKAMIEAHITECAGDAGEAGPDRVRSAWIAMIEEITKGLQEAPSEAKESK